MGKNNNKKAQQQQQPGVAKASAPSHSKQEIKEFDKEIQEEVAKIKEKYNQGDAPLDDKQSHQSKSQKVKEVDKQQEKIQTPANFAEIDSNKQQVNRSSNPQPNEQQQQQYFQQQQAKQAAKFNPQYDPSQYQSLNQCDKNLQDLQERIKNQKMDDNQRKRQQQHFQQQMRQPNFSRMSDDQKINACRDKEIKKLEDHFKLNPNQDYDKQTILEILQKMKLGNGSKYISNSFGGTTELSQNDINALLNADEFHLGYDDNDDQNGDEDDDEDFEDEDDEFYGEEDHYNDNDDCQEGPNDDDEEDEEDEDYENEYPDEQDSTELESIEKNQFQISQRYDYGTDDEEEKESDQVFKMRGVDLQNSSDQETVNLKITQTSDISQEDFHNFLHKCTLTLPPQLSQKFVRLSKEFNNNIDYIMNYVYKLITQGPAPSNSTDKIEKNKFTIKYENLLKQSQELCRKYTGPHSVLQIFLEKIIACIGQISLQIKNLAKNELKLWKEYKAVIRRTTANTLQRSSSADSGLLITTTSQQPQDRSDIKNKFMRPQQIEETYRISVRFKPLLQNIEFYKRFLQEVQNKYIFIMKQCAPTVSKHFTNLTSVIIEGNSYEFPSNELHKAIMNKLIMNDSQHFKQFFAHIKMQYKKDENIIKEKYPDFAKLIESFMTQIEQDNSKIINIDQYMRDLKRHAQAEYKTLSEREQLTNCNSDSKSKRKKKKDKLRKAAASIGVSLPPNLNNINNNQQQQQQLASGQQPGVQGQQQQQQFRQSQQSNFQQNPNSFSQQNYQQQLQYSNAQQQVNKVQKDQQDKAEAKKKRNRKKKNKEGKLTQEEIAKMPTEDLFNYINNNAAAQQEQLKQQNKAGGKKKNNAKLSIQEQDIRLRKNIMEDISKLDQFVLNQHQLRDIKSKELQFNIQQFKNFRHNFNNTQSTATSGVRTNPMNSLREQEFNEDINCNCNGIFNQGFYIHEEGCCYQVDYGSEIEENEREQIEEDEGDSDKVIEEFRRNLERTVVQNSKAKLKPNITLDWISKLKEYLKNSNDRIQEASQATNNLNDQQKPKIGTQKKSS